jgi:hypothetical protein
MWAKNLGGSTIRLAGLQGQACALFQAARRLSLLRLSALLGAPPAADVCPAFAEDIVAMAAFAIIGLIAPLAATWLVEINYRAAFARAQGPAALAQGPAVLRWPKLLRFTAAETALVLGAVLAVSFLDLLVELH